MMARADTRPNVAGSLLGRDVLTLADFTPEEFTHLVAESLRWKLGLRTGLPLHGKTLAMVFRKHSTRTRVSAEVAMAQLGGRAIFLHESDTQLARGEPLRDTARVLARYVDGILVRTHAHAEVCEWAAWSDKPVFNALTDRDHPLQALADVLTLAERLGRTERLLREEPGFLSGLRLAYVGDANNVAEALMYGAALSGMELWLAAPEGYGPRPEALARARAIGEATGARLVLASAPEEAVAGAHAVYTDVWVSMGDEAEAEARRAAFRGFGVDRALFSLADPEAVFLHCLPAHRGEEVEDEVLEGAQSAVFDQAENRLHTKKAVFAETM